MPYVRDPAKKAVYDKAYRAITKPWLNDTTRVWRLNNHAKLAVYSERHRGVREEWELNNKPHRDQYQRDRHLRKKYGISEVEWDAMFIAQGCCCASCGSADPWGPYWHTDHKGSLPCTKENIRGILCLRCNYTAGSGEQDDIQRLRLLVLYLEKHQ